jgi:hypothetical protein
MADGHLNKCKGCAKLDVRQNYHERIDYYHRYEWTRQQRPERKLAKLIYQSTHRAKHPDKYQARSAVGNAIKQGKLIPQPCQNCGATQNVEAHHHNYSRPLDVDWLCFTCHREEHEQTVTHDLAIDF